MARRSKLDLRYGDAIREGIKVACPICGTDTIWNGVPEFSRHVRYCRTLALGLAQADVCPSVPAKPEGWEWLEP